VTFVWLDLALNHVYSFQLNAPWTSFTANHGSAYFAQGASHLTGANGGVAISLQQAGFDYLLWLSYDHTDINLTLCQALPLLDHSHSQHNHPRPHAHSKGMATPTTPSSSSCPATIRPLFGINYLLFFQLGLSDLV